MIIISLQAAIDNILSPAIMFFILGLIAAIIRSDLEIPDSFGAFLTMFILTSIGLKAGIAVRQTGISEIIIPVLAAIIVGAIITFTVYYIMLKIGFDAANAGSIGGHYGACSSVTLTTVIVFLSRMGVNFEEFVPALYPFMDTAALITGIVLGHAGLKKKKIDSDDEYSIKNIFKESLRSKSTVLIIGGLIIGLTAGVKGTEDLMPFYSTAFDGIFTIFMLDIGIITGRRISVLKNVKPVTYLIAIIMPPAQAVIAILIANFIGLSPGGATVFAVLAAGASYISAPAVMRSTFPDSNPSIALGMSLGIIFPFNIILGIPLYYQIAIILS